MKRDPLKARHPFFLPLYRRVLTVGACFAWGGVELYLDNAIWSALFAGLGAYLAYQFFVIFDPEDYTDG